MNKPQFIKAVAEQAQGTQVEARKFVDAVEAVVVDALERGEEIKLAGFLTFETKEVAETTGRNPQNGEAVVIPAHRKATVKLAKALRKF